jgi:hypothetical protein
MLETLTGQLVQVNAGDRLARLETLMSKLEQSSSDHNSKLVKLMETTAVLQSQLEHFIDQHSSEAGRPANHTPAAIPVVQAVEPQQPATIVIGWAWKNRNSIVQFLTFVLAFLGLSVHFKSCATLEQQVSSGHTPALASSTATTDGGLHKEKQ